MGVYNCQLYNNLGLCCFYAQQYDMTLSSFERALALAANDEEQADVWYNIGHVAVVSYESSEVMSAAGRCRDEMESCDVCLMITGHSRPDAGLSELQTCLGF